MGPLPEDQKKYSSSSKDDNNDEEYIRDGWQLGFAVEMNGIGNNQLIIDDNEPDSDSEGYEGPGDGSDDENNDIRRAGYQQLAIIPNGEGDVSLLSEDESKDTDEILGETNVEIPTEIPPQASIPAFVSNHMKKDFDEALSNASNVHLKDSDFIVEKATSKIDLTDDKIEEIRQVANNLKLKPPSWASDIDDEKLKQMLDKIKASKD